MVLAAGFEPAKRAQNFRGADLLDRELAKVAVDQSDEPFVFFEGRLGEAFFLSLGEPFLGKSRKIVVGGEAP